jgi:hypothetical protein
MSKELERRVACNGDWFMADNFLYYRCRSDHSIIPLRSGDKPEKCSHCGRPVAPEVKLIKPQIRSARQVKLGDHWVNLG